jgi:hypothetical protein
MKETYERKGVLEIMNNFTFLTQEQCFKNDKLDIFEKRGTKAAITDFSVLLGGWVWEHAENDSSLEGRTGCYWTKSDDGDTNARVVEDDGSSCRRNVQKRYIGARPALPFSSIGSIPTNGESVKRARDGILEVEYGYYPQKAVSKDMQERLERAYRSESISKTRNIYTTDSVDHNKDDTSFQPQTHQEYEYNGKRYVRVKANSYYDGYDFTLSNDEQYRDGDNVWVEVQPVKWLVDEKSRMMITEKIIFAGVQFNKERNYHTRDFDRTDIKTFMDRYLSKDLVQSRSMLKQTRTSSNGAKKNENPYNLDFSETSEADVIRTAIQSNVSIFLHGKPGCGKSDRVKQLDPDFIELNLSHLDPELLDGLAGEKDGKSVHIKPPWLEELEAKCQEETDKIHILFLEELTNASPMMQSKAYGIALDKKVAGRWKLPENARVVAAGNELEDSLVANEMAEPLYDRFAHVNIETNKENWLEWAVTPESFYERLDYNKETQPKQKIHPAIYAFISYKGDEVLRTPYNREHPEPHADPRRWKMASDMLYASNNPSTLKAIVGEDLTRDFIYFCQLPTITIEDVLKGNYTGEELEEMDLGRKLATVSGLVAVDSENMPKVREFTKKLGAEICKKFEVQWIYGDEERLEQLQEIIMQEQEETEKRISGEHSGDEAKETAHSGILAFKKIFGSYQEYLEREVEEDKSK